MNTILKNMLCLPLSLFVVACELPGKNLGEPMDDTTADSGGSSAGETGGVTEVQMAAPDTLDPDTTTGGEETGGGPSTGVLAAPDTLDPMTTGTTGDGGEVQCVGDPPVFPEFSKECAVDGDCAVVFHQLDCCGSRAGIGIDADEVDAFNEAEALCTSQYPLCECAPQPTSAEDGQAAEDEAQILAQCVGNVCQSFVPGDPCDGVDLPECPPECTPEMFPGGCGEPCEPEGATCGNNIGDGMVCSGGLWQCSVHPPLGEGCNLVCK